MKKRGLWIIAVMVLIGAVLTACGADLAEWIARGDQQLVIEDYEGALEYYRRAGDEGIEKAKEVHLIIAKGKLWNDDFSAVHEYLTTDAQGMFTEEEIGVFLLGHLNQALEEEHEKYTAKLDELEAQLEQYKTSEDVDYSEKREITEDLSSNVGWYGKAIRELVTDATEVIPEGTPGLQETLNQVYFDLGRISLRGEKLSNYENVIWNTVLDSWKKCTDGPGYEIINAIGQIHSKSYLEGFQTLKLHLGDKEILHSLYSSIVSSIKPENMQDILDLENARIAAFEEDNTEHSLQEVFQNISYKIGSDHLKGNTLLSSGMLEELNNLCGNNPDGKILILHKPSKDTNSISIFLCGMQYLPNSFYPSNLESVEYVILMECDSVLTGATFQKGTKEIREDTTVTIYDAKTGRAIWNKTVEGPTDFVFTYTGDPPEYHSAGAPYVSLDDVMAEIEKYLN